MDLINCHLKYGTWFFSILFFGVLFIWRLCSFLSYSCQVHADDGENEPITVTACIVSWVDQENFRGNTHDVHFKVQDFAFAAFHKHEGNGFLQQYLKRLRTKKKDDARSKKWLTGKIRNTVRILARNLSVTGGMTEIRRRSLQIFMTHIGVLPF